MTGASWLASGAGVVVAALCVIGLRHHHHLPAVTHPWLVRTAIFLAYVAGCAVAQSALGSYVTSALSWILGTVGAPGSVAGHDAVTVAGSFLFATVAVAIIWLPQPPVMFIAAGTPFVLQVAGGHLHALLNIVPAAQWVEAISHWIGG